MLKDYFSFNKRQRNGILVLLGIVMGMLIWLNVLNNTASLPVNANKTIARPNALVKGSGIKSKTDNQPITDSVHKLCINTITIKELSKQPNFNYYLAQAIVNYREQHGPYKTLKDLLKSAAVDSLTFSKISPYLTVN